MSKKSCTDTTPISILISPFQESSEFFTTEDTSIITSTFLTLNVCCKNLPNLIRHFEILFTGPDPTSFTLGSEPTC